MKNWLPFVLLFINSFPVNSQVNDSTIISITPTKLITGMAIGYSNIKHNATINSQNFSSNNPSINLSLLFEKEFNNQFKFSLRPGILLGSFIKNKFKDANKEYTYSYSSAIIEMPLLFVYTFRANKIVNGVPNFERTFGTFNSSGQLTMSYIIKLKTKLIKKDNKIDHLEEKLNIILIY